MTDGNSDGACPAKSRAKRSKSIRYTVLGKGLPKADTPVKWDLVPSEMGYKGTHDIVCNASDSVRFHEKLG